jgi:phage minor structural protein
MIHILDFKTKKIVAILENKPGSPLVYWNDEHHEELKTNIETFDFITAEGTSAAPYLVGKNLIIIQDEDGYFRPFSIWQTRKYLDGSIAVKSNLDHFNLKKQKVIPPQIFEGQTIITILDTILSGTDWQRGITETNDVRTVTIADHTNPLAVLQDLKSLYGLELRFRCDIVGNRITGHYVDMIKRTGTDRGKEIVVGKDLQSLERIEDIETLCTALWVVGPQDQNGNIISIASINGGKEFVEDLEALARWSEDGRHLWGIYTPDSTSTNMTPSELLALANTELKKRINATVSYNASAADLENIFGLSHEKVRLGDTVRIKDEKFSPPLYLEARVIDSKRSLSDKTKKATILGDYIEYRKEDTEKKVKYLEKLLADRNILFDGNDTLLKRVSREYSERVSVYVPAQAYVQGDYIETTITLNDYTTVGIKHVSKIDPQSLAKEMYAYEKLNSRIMDSNGNLQSFVLRLSPYYAHTVDTPFYLDVEIVITGWR